MFLTNFSARLEDLLENLPEIFDVLLNYSRSHFLED